MIVVRSMQECNQERFTRMTAKRHRRQPSGAKKGNKSKTGPILRPCHWKTPQAAPRTLTSACPTYAPLKGAKVIPWDVSIMGSVLQYRRTSQSLQSRVLSCLHATVKTQPVQLRTKTESTQAAMNTLHGNGVMCKE